MPSADAGDDEQQRSPTALPASSARSGAGMPSSTTMRGIAARTCDGSGTTKRLIAPTRISTSTSANDPTSVAKPSAGAASGATMRSRRGRGGRAHRASARCRLARFVVAHAAARFLAQVVPDLRDVVAERVAADDLGRSRSRQVDVERALQPAGAVRHHDHAIGELHGFGDVVRDQQRRLVAAAAGSAAPCRRAAGASARRARRTARPSAGSAAATRACARSRRAAACRRRARPGSGARTRRGRPSTTKRRARSCRSRFPTPASSSGNATLSMTERHGNADSSWNTMPNAAMRARYGFAVDRRRGRRSRRRARR